jgi:hypothetical protein
MSVDAFLHLIPLFGDIIKQMLEVSEPIRESSQLFERSLKKMADSVAFLVRRHSISVKNLLEGRIHRTRR